MDPSALNVTLAALLTAVATGLGALPFFFYQNFSSVALGRANGLAAGLMLSASGMLVYEGYLHSLGRMALGVGLGVVAIAISRYLLDGSDEEAAVGQLRGADALEALLIVGVMTAHSFAEGVGVGVSYGDGDTLGVFVTVAIAIHNIPEGLAISLVLVPRGVSAWKAGGWSVVSSLPQPLMALPAFLFVESFAPVLPVGLGFAAGAMAWMVGREMIPEALGDAPPRTVAGAVAVGLVAMTLFQYLMH
ncbi:ZIP family metal transporter [Salisaeta longa]|uniref:ZIP family metal transporter n=1 Tax=Salisaeta longa TaxID=503170 RepID=UPI0003B36D97|nr:ZIP family metal transporter [Salisaeta longa]